MADSIKRPAFSLHITELWRANKERIQGQKMIDEMPESTAASNHPVLVIPGFMASEVSTKPLRRLLEKKGYMALDWGLGRNYARVGDVEKLSQTVAEIYNKNKRPLTIIGWSLGGLYARRLAVLHGDKLRRVITLAAPYKDVNAPNYARWLFQLFEQLRSGTTQPPQWLTDLAKPLSVPTVAFYSKEDGIVPWEATMDPYDSSDHLNIEVKSSHIGLGANPEVLDHLIKILEKDDQKEASTQ